MSIIFLVSAFLFFVYYFFFFKTKKKEISCSIFSYSKAMGLGIIIISLILYNIGYVRDNIFNKDIYYLCLTVGLIIVILSKDKLENKNTKELKAFSLFSSVIFVTVVSQVLEIFKYKIIDKINSSEIVILILITYLFFFYVIKYFQKED